MQQGARRLRVAPGIALQAQDGRIIRGDWLRQRPAVAMPVAEPAKTEPAPSPAPAPTAANAPRRKLGYKETRELEALPGKIEELEARIAAHTERMNTPDYFQRNAAEVQADNAALDAMQQALDAAYSRWEELDAG